MEAGDDLSDVVMSRPDPERVGSFLRARRLELGLTYADVANVVKLSPRRIELLENERWDELPDGPFLRGFLRNVARALDLDATSLTERVDASLMRSRNPDSILVPQGATHATLPRRSGPVDDRHGGQALVIGACMFAVIAALIAWSGTESFDRALSAGKSMIRPTAPIVASSQPAVVAPPVATPSSDAQSSSTVTSPSDAGTPVSVAKSNDGASAAAGPSTTSAPLTFHFNEESWVEVRAADGKILLQRLNAAGSEQQVDGEAPFSLVVGNAKGVELRFRGQSVDLAPHIRDQVARLTLS